MKTRRTVTAQITWGMLACAAFLLVTLSPARAVAGEASLTWNQSSETDLAGYRVHYGTASRNYLFSVDVGNLTSYTVTGLGLGTYYFAVTAYDQSGNESGYSAEVSKTIATAPDTTPPVISSIVATGVTSSAATIAWSTNEAATSQVEYGTTTAYGASTPLSSSLVTSHSRPLGGLQPSMLYHYRVWSVDGAGNVAVSADNTVTTLAAPDTTPPGLSGITASNITSNGAVITWTTNEASNTQVDYGTTTSYGSSTTLNSTLVTSHSQTLSGLQANTLYHYRVKSRDAAGNLATSGDFTFTTSTVPDTTGPVISNVAAGNVSSVGATITWTTNEAATSQVDYGTTAAYGSSTALSATLVTSHSRTLSGLQPNTLYHYQVRSADGANNLTVSVDRTLTTGAAADTTPPGDVRQFAAASGDQQITLGWTNPPDGDFIGARVLFRTDRFPVGLQDGTLLGDFTGQPNATMSTVHAGLQNGVTYYYSASSYDLSGNYQMTANASATPTLDRVDDPGAAMGCGGSGMIGPAHRGPGAGQPGANLLPSFLILIAVGCLKWLRRAFSYAASYSEHLTLHFTGGSPVMGYAFSNRRQWASALLGVFFCLWAVPAVAGQATVSWRANQELDLMGYRVYYGTVSQNYAQYIDVGDMLSYTIAGLTEGITYYFAVTAFDAFGNQSGYSPEAAAAISSSSPSSDPNGIGGGGGCGTMRGLSKDAAPAAPQVMLDLMMLSIPLMLVNIRRRIQTWQREVGLISAKAFSRLAFQPTFLAGVMAIALFIPLNAVAAPVVLYTDITSGPNTGGENNQGIYVSIFGKGFGTTKGSSTVTINGVEVAAYKQWGSPSRVFDSHGIQVITVQPGAAVSSGPIVVTVSGGASNNSHAFIVRPGDMYFVSHSGSDSTGQIGSISQPFRTLQTTYNRSDFGPGDTIVIRGDGTEWTDGARFLQTSKGGSSGMPMTFMGYPGEAVMIPQRNGNRTFDTDHPHLVFSNMRITKWQDNNALTQVGFSVGAGDYRIVNVEVAGSQPGYLGAIGQAFNNAKILGNNIHDNGWSGDPSWNTAHAMYLESGSNVEIGWNWIKNQLGGRCIQLRNASGTSTNAEIHSNVFSNCARSAVLMGAGWTTGIKIYNNLFYDVQSDQGVIRATSVSNALSPEIYSNSFYNNGDDSVSLETNLATAPIIRNNILSESAGGSYCSGTPCSVTIGSHNLCFGNGNCPANWLSSINANPLFVSPTSPSRNFHLQNGSPAIDSGFSVSILRDFDGTIRALQGSAFDIGAYEFCGQNCSVDTTPPANPTGLTVN